MKVEDIKTPAQLREFLIETVMREKGESEENATTVAAAVLQVVKTERDVAAFLEGYTRKGGKYV